jgi:hypothetical protein
MALLKACPECGRPMTAFPDEVWLARLRYVCAKCDGDPLRDPTARKWVGLRPPEK